MSYKMLIISLLIDYLPKCCSKESIVNNLGLFSTVTFYLDNKHVFESIPLQTEISSFVYNDLVLVIKDSKFYLLDGYPSLESLGENKSASEQLRNENVDKRNTNWNKFINSLKEEGKII